MSESIKSRQYLSDHEGYVDWLYISHGEFDRDMYWGYAYLKGRKHDAHPALGLGLRFRGNEDEYPHSAQIHEDDIPEFVDRVKCFQTLRDGFVADDNGSMRPMTQEEIDASIDRLCVTGVMREELIETTLQSRAQTLNHQVLHLGWLMRSASER